jgi:hypothetical protein
LAGLKPVELQIEIVAVEREVLAPQGDLALRALLNLLCSLALQGQIH